MPQDAACPQCQTAFPVTEARAAFTVACPKCDAEMTVEFKKPATPPEAGQPHYDLLVKPGALAAASAPAAGPTRRRDIDDEEALKKKGGSATIVVVSGVLGMLFVLGGLGLTAWVLFDVIDTTPTRTTKSSSQTKGGQNKAGQPNQPNQPNQPKNEFELIAATGPNVVVTAPPFDLTAPREFPLPGTVVRVTVGGNGRLLVMMDDSGRLLCFDVSTGKLTVGPQTNQIGGAPMAAGLSRLAYLEPEGAGRHKLHVHDLPSLQRRYTSSVPIFHANGSIAMGSATNGPVLSCDPFGEVTLIELTDTEARPVPGSQGKVLENAQGPVRASANGRLFVRSEFNASTQTVLLTEAGRRWKPTAVPMTAALPHPDGRSALGFGLIVRENGQTVGARVPNGVWYVPGVAGNHFLRVTAAGGVASASVHKNYNNPEKEKVAPPIQLPELGGMDGTTGGCQPLDQHLFLIPDAKVLVTLDRGGTKLTLRRVEIK